MNKTSIITWVVALTLITHVSCKKESGSIGLNAGDSALQPIEIDTFSLITRTVEEDSLRTSGTSYQMLGATRTAEFGYTSSAMALSFALPTSSFAFPAGVVIDSVVLQAQYTGPDQYVGNLATPMTITIAEIDERLHIDSVYYSDKQIPTKASNSQTFTNILHDLTDSVEVLENGKQNTYAPHLRLKLGPQMVSLFANAQAGDLGSISAFQTYFNGLKFEVDGSGLANGQGNIVYFNFNTSSSGLAVYFNDTGKYVFPVGANGVKINLYDNDFSTVPAIQTQLNSPGANFDLTYVQSMAGLKTRVDIPHLLKLLDDGTYAIIDAKFQFYYDPVLTIPGFPAFSRMILVKRDSSDKNNFVADQLLNSAFYGGTKHDDGYYEFHVTREIQYIINSYRLNGEDLNTGFFLIAPSDNPMTASHMQMDMRKGLAKGVKFVVTLVKTK
ncbi:MAG TPA: hypothetical protein DIW47_02960 [Bacteroidetes bacterium]|nr:hypothetical protein [Bacteroidota bacterium]